MIYLTDGTRDGFLTAFLAAWGDEEAVLLPKNERPLGPCVEVVPDPKRAQKALCRFRELDGGCMRELGRLLRCGDEGHLQTAFRYLLLIAKRGGPVRGMLSHPDVLKAEQALRRVAHEIDRMKGFVRFSESASGALYAPLSPDNDIVDILARHFQKRLPEYHFVLHDVKRKKAAVWDGEHLFLAPLVQAEVMLSADEDGWQTLWKTYYSAVNIPSRERLRQQRGYLPVRYRKFMTEFQ